MTQSIWFVPPNAKHTLHSDQFLSDSVKEGDKQTTGPSQETKSSGRILTTLLRMKQRSLFNYIVEAHILGSNVT